MEYSRVKRTWKAVFTNLTFTCIVIVVEYSASTNQLPEPITRMQGAKWFSPSLLYGSQNVPVHKQRIFNKSTRQTT